MNHCSPAAALLLLLTACPTPDGTPPEPTPPPPEPVLLSTFTVAPRGATGVQPLVAGVPFAQGVVETPATLTLQADEALPARWTALSLWPDGSIRWAQLQAALPLPTDGSDLELAIWTGAGPELEPTPPMLPPMHLEVARASGTTEVPLEEAEVEVDGLQIRWSLSELPASRSRLALRVAQLEGEDRWDRITLHLDDDSALDLAEADAGGASLAALSVASGDGAASWAD